MYPVRRPDHFDDLYARLLACPAVFAWKSGVENRKAESADHPTNRLNIAAADLGKESACVVRFGVGIIHSSVPLPFVAR